MKQYPIGIQNFESLIKDGYYYVDKTQLVYKLITEGRYYFLSRPRRFGKSLLLSTIQAYFEGKRELFKGLAIDSLAKDWTPHPILHLDLNTQKYESPESLENVLDEQLAKWEKLYGSNPLEKGLARRFNGIISRVREKTGQRVVILVDEYDKPMLQAIGNDGLHISMSPWFYDVCGISETELEADFKDDIGELAEAQGMTYADCLAELKRQYDGYHFEENAPGVYNPFSLLNTFYNKKFGNYWFETGTPTYLVKLLQMHNYDLEEMSHDVTSEDVLNSIDPASTDPIPVIYQSGYLTIKDYDKEFMYYTLGFPNEEVERGFIKYLMPYYTTVTRGKTAFEISRFVQEARRGDYDAFLTRLRSFYADIPYEMQRDLEVHYQNVLFIVFRLLGFHAGVEYRTSNGRVDLVVKTDKYIYVMEFKLDGTAEEAMRQINDKGYAEPFKADGRQVVKLGINFSRETKTIDKWIAEL